jgi:cytoskeletal protein CcmA (bactofilin family)
VAGTIQAERVIVDGTVEGPIQGGSVMLKSGAHVVGDSSCGGVSPSERFALHSDAQDTLAAATL